MKASALQDLLAIWSLASVDTGVTLLTAHSAFREVPSNDGKLEISFKGIHCTASRLSESLPPIASKPIMLPGTRFVDTISLFEPEEELVVDLVGNELVIRNADSKVHLRVHSELPEDELPESTCTQWVVVESAKDFSTAINFLGNTTSQQLHHPVLMGIRMEAKDGLLELRGTDGARSGRLALPCSGTLAPVVAHAGDLSAAAQLFPGKVSIGMDELRLELRDDYTKVRLTVLNGQFPELNISRQTYVPLARLVPKAIDRAGRASTLFDSDKLVTVEASEKRVKLVVKGQELGAFEQVSGRSRLDASFTLNGDHFGLAAQMGEAPILYYRGPPPDPILIVGKVARKECEYWLSPVVLRGKLDR